jgi:hypothetical protein
MGLGVLAEMFKNPRRFEYLISIQVQHTDVFEVPFKLIMIDRHKLSIQRFD